MSTEAEVIADLARAAEFNPEVVTTPGGREILVLPEGFSHHEVTPANKLPILRPDHIRQKVTVQTADSLIDYGRRFKTDETVLLADIDASRILAQIDYHEARAAGHLAHAATLQLTHSIEWAEWHRISGRLMEQLEFARFIEENAADIHAPDAATLIECVRDLQAHRKVNFTKAVRTSSENENFEFSEETEARSKRGNVGLPTRFVISIPVYFGEPDTELHAFLRWKLDTDKGALTLGIQLHRSEHVRQAEFQRIVTDIAERSECPAYFGKI